MEQEYLGKKNRLVLACGYLLGTRTLHGTSACVLEISGKIKAHHISVLLFAQPSYCRAPQPLHLNIHRDQVSLMGLVSLLVLGFSACSRFSDDSKLGFVLRFCH